MPNAGLTPLPLAARCKLGAAVVVEPRSVGGGRLAVIRDPAGATCALFQSPNVTN